MKLRGGIAERYGLALLLLVAALVYSIAVPDGEWRRLLATLLQFAALFATLGAAEVNRRVMRLVGVVLILTLLAGFVQAGFGNDASPTFVRFCVLVILVASLPMLAVGLIRQVRSDQKVSLQTMMGVLCAYLLLMSSFAYAYAVIGDLGSEPFFSQGAQWDSLGDYIYFSLITITTVGFGDLTPATDLGRSLTAAEALIGQIYVVTVVAVIVSNLGRTGSPRAGARDTEPDKEDPTAADGAGGDAPRG